MFSEVKVIGNLGADPELRFLQDGTEVYNFSVCSNRRWLDQASGENREEKTWFRCSVWRKQAVAVNENLAKGSQVMVIGRMRPDPETGGPRIFSRQDGTVGASYELTCNRVLFLGKPNGNGNEPGSPGATEEDEIPF